MQISRQCTIDIDDERYFDNLWFPYLFFGCDKASVCKVFKTCILLHTGMQNILLGIGVLAIVLGVFWVLHTCINKLGCTKYCSTCGYYDPNLCNNSDNETEQLNGRKRRRREKQCGNCVRHRNVTSSELACHLRPERRCNSWTPARVHASYHGPDHVNPPPFTCGCMQIRCTSDRWQTCSQWTTMCSPVRRSSFLCTGGAGAGPLRPHAPESPWAPPIRT